jgi:hypothetical protein
MSGQKFDALLRARAGALSQASGKIGPAAARLSYRLTWDDELRLVAATTLIAMTFEPAFSAHRDAFARDMGALEEFIEGHCPAADDDGGA